MKIVLLGSGKGTTARAVLEAQRRGELGASSVVGIIANQPAAGILQVAADFGVRGVCAGTNGYPELGSAVADLQPDYLVSVGFSEDFPVELLQRFPGRVLNLYPSLLPSFGGLRGMGAVTAALSYGARVVGSTVYALGPDHGVGKILAQTAIDVPAGIGADALVERLQQAERALLPSVLAAL